MFTIISPTMTIHLFWLKFFKICFPLPIPSSIHASCFSFYLIFNLRLLPERLQVKQQPRTQLSQLFVFGAFLSSRVKYTRKRFAGLNRVLFHRPAIASRTLLPDISCGCISHYIITLAPCIYRCCKANRIIIGPVTGHQGSAGKWKDKQLY